MCVCGGGGGGEGGGGFHKVNFFLSMIIQIVPTV